MIPLRSLLSGPVVTAARGLLGRLLVSDVGGVRTAVILTEVEAYGGVDDEASHAHRGRSMRNASMFGAPGTLYVYRSYGVHWCANVVCGPTGTPSAVLVRGGEAHSGIVEMERRRARVDHLCDGPGKLAQALGITGELDGSSILDGVIRVEGPSGVGKIRSSPRVGITRATSLPWRFVLVRKRMGPVDNPRA
ncbi:MAG TPA: DNA-3-methyladenine glycosylase [Acidimicrobiia bacterium]|nr:DNA-3-methyladenine glycosylase [Acidimicrobiia bacterium]